MRGASNVKRALAFVGGLMPSVTAKTCATAEGRSNKGHYRLLPKEFRHGGFTYRQIFREKDAAIYEQTWNACPDPALCFELIRVKRREAFQIDGRLIEPAEAYPNSEAWGADGFTFADKDAAFAKLRALRSGQ
jgi:hypothetical protein